MDFRFGCTFEHIGKSKSDLIAALESGLQQFLKEKNYGAAVQEYLIILYIINPPEGYGHLFKDFKPRFTEHKIVKNKHTNVPFTISKHFSYSIKIDGALYREFIRSSDVCSRQILAKAIFDSLGNVDKLPKKIKDFNKAQFKEAIKQFFEDRILL